MTNTRPDTRHSPPKHTAAATTHQRPGPQPLPPPKRRPPKRRPHPKPHTPSNARSFGETAATTTHIAALSPKPHPHRRRRSAAGSRGPCELPAPPSPRSGVPSAFFSPYPGLCRLRIRAVFGPLSGCEFSRIRASLRLRSNPTEPRSGCESNPNPWLSRAANASNCSCGSGKRCGAGSAVSGSSQGHSRMVLHRTWSGRLGLITVLRG